MLEKQRKAIDEIDQQMVRLLEKRMDVVEEVAEIKKANQMSVLDTNREKQVLQKISGYVTNTDYEGSILKVYQAMMDISKDYQKGKIDA